MLLTPLLRSGYNDRLKRTYVEYNQEMVNQTNEFSGAIVTGKQIGRAHV